MPPQGKKTDLYHEMSLNGSDMSESDPHVGAIKTPPTMEPTKWRIVWRSVFFFTVLHIASIYSTYVFFTEKIKLATFVFMVVIYLVSGLGITAGAHRLWSHKTYKAKWPLQLILVIFNTISGQLSVITWTRNHRMHHKYSETDADPHNSHRGFFFSHIGWLFVKKHPTVLEYGHTIDLSDLYNNPLLKFQRKYYYFLMPLFCFVLPAYIPTLWGESYWNALHLCGILRFILVLHGTFLVNSVTHMWGMRPYDRDIGPGDLKTVSAITLGEGFHNYHHTFPWDYKTNELGNYTLNITTLFIDTMAAIGWAYDLKTASNELILSRVKRSGDGSHASLGLKKNF